MSESTNSEPYFQFPISLIHRKSKTMTENLHSAISYALCNVAKELTEANAQFNADAYRRKYPEAEEHGRNLVSRNIMAAANLLHLKIGSFEAEEQFYFHEFIRLNGKPGFQVRLRTDIAWDAINHEWHPMKVKTLVAVYAALGNRPAAKLYHRLLRALVSGFESPRNKKEADMVAESSLRYWLDHCHQRQLFKVCLHNGVRWYGIAFKDDAELAKHVLRIASKPKRRDLISTDAIPEKR